MDSPSPRLEDLESTYEKIIYDAYHLQQPDLVKEIEILVRTGYAPTDIENFMRSVTPKGSQLADYVYWIASYILRQHISQT